MNFHAVPNLKARKHADLIILPFWKGKQTAEPAAAIGSFNEAIDPAIDCGDFFGKEKEILFFYTNGTQPERRIALLGLGSEEKITVEKLRQAYGALCRACHKKKIKTINLLLPHIPSLAEENTIRGIVEGLLLANYQFEQLKHDSIKDNPAILLSQATLIGADKSELAIANQLVTIAQGVYLARDLVNGNADDVTPQYLAKVAKDLGKLPHVKTTIFDKKRIEKEKMGLLLAVNRASQNDPAFIIVEYRGNPKSKENTVLVGKGVTHDTGGLLIKPKGFMETMKCDMGGAATVLGTLFAAASLKLKVNLTGVIPSTDNAIGPGAYKPGDVYKSYLGKTVEIVDTDAEGRLILADALAYAVKNLKPTRIIDFATLTGAVEVALGAEAAGLMSNDDALADNLMNAGFETYERVCRLPLYEEYRDRLKSDIADMKNVAGRSGGAIVAAMFLKDFIGDTPWAHCDIAGTAYISEPKPYIPKYGTGFGVRLMIDYLTRTL